MTPDPEMVVAEALAVNYTGHKSNGVAYKVPAKIVMKHLRDAGYVVVEKATLCWDCTPSPFPKGAVG